MTQEHHPHPAASDILDYWARVELFTPYMLDNVISTQQELIRVYAQHEEPLKLPWKDELPLLEHDASNAFESRYHIYFNVFNLEETADRGRRHFKQHPDSWSEARWQVCDTRNKLTCFARLSVTAYGTPLWAP